MKRLLAVVVVLALFGANIAQAAYVSAIGLNIADNSYGGDFVTTSQPVEIKGSALRIHNSVALVAQVQ